MSYDVLISRHDRWSSEGEPRISPHEWLKAVDLHSDFKRTQYVGGGEVWLMGFDEEAGCYEAAFNYVDGQIFVTNPSQATLTRMGQMAKALNAKAIGENDEVYNEEGAPDRKSHYTPWS